MSQNNAEPRISPKHAGGNFLLNFIFRGKLVTQIIVGLIAGIILAAVWPEAAMAVSLLGDFFVGALKAVAPVLVLVLVCAAITNHKQDSQARMGPVVMLYVLGTFLAAVLAVVASFMFPVTLQLTGTPETMAAPEGLAEVVKNILLKLVDNPVNAIAEANYIGILAWAIAFGLVFRHAGDTTKNLMSDLDAAITKIVKAIIRLAPIGIFGIVASTIAATGFGALVGYANLLALLIGCMLVMALVVNPLIVFLRMRKNPYPLVFTCLRELGITAFFMRSSAANIPVNIELCRRMSLDEETYSVTIPIGATVNMAGAAITITVMTLAAVNTLGHPCRLRLGRASERHRRHRRRRRLGCRGRLAAADPDGRQPVRHRQRDGHAGGEHRLHHRRAAGFGRDRAELVHRRAVHRRRLLQAGRSVSAQAADGSGPRVGS